MKPKTNRQTAPQLDPETAKKVLDSDLANLLKRVKSGTPLTSGQRRLIAQQSGTSDRRFDSFGAAAHCLKITVAMVKRAKKSGCLAFRNGRIAEAELVRWLSEHRQQLGANSPADLDGARLADLLEKTRQRKMTNDQKAGQLVNCDEVRRGATEAMGICFAELERIFLHELPPAVKGLTEVEIQAICAQRIEQLRDTLRAKFEEIGK